MHRTVEFAVEMQDIIERFNSKTGYHLALRAGINTGHVISGLVGRSSIVYDMWGAAVNLAHSVRGSTSQAGIYVTTAVYEAMGDIRQFAPAGTVTVAGTEQQIWRLAEER